MSTATVTGAERPLKVIWSPDEAEHTARRVQKTRWGRFLVARAVVTLHRVGEGAAEWVERLHLGPMVRLAARALGWLTSGVAMVRQGLRVQGVVPGPVWATTTQLGQRLARTVTTTVASVVGSVTRAVGKAVNGALRMFGKPGGYVADKLTHGINTVRATVVARLSSAFALFTALPPVQALTQFLAVIARERTVMAVAGRFLTHRWAVLVRLVLNAGLVPSQVRRQALTLVLGLISRPATGTATLASEPAGSEDPDDDPTTPAPSAVIVDLDAQRLSREELEALEELEQVMPQLQNYPASRRSPNAKKRR